MLSAFFVNRPKIMFKNFQYTPYSLAGINFGIQLLLQLACPVRTFCLDTKSTAAADRQKSQENLKLPTHCPAHPRQIFRPTLVVFKI